MPANLQYDILLGGLGYMLARDPKNRGRAWQRSGVTDTISTERRTVRTLYGGGEEFGGLPAELDAPIVWNDWSGGYGHYRESPNLPFTEKDNHYHWAVNMDLRFPGMGYNAQQPQTLPTALGSLCGDAVFISDVPAGANLPLGHGQVLIQSNVIGSGSGIGTFGRLSPTSLPYTSGSAFTLLGAVTGSGPLGLRPAVFGSNMVVPYGTRGFWAQPIGTTGGATAYTYPANWLTVSNGRLWRGEPNGAVQSIGLVGTTADLSVTANWSATLALGNGWEDTLDARSFENDLYVGFPDGLYEGDASGTFNNVLTDVGIQVNRESGRNLTIHNGQIIFPEGQNVWGYKPSSGANSVLRQLWPNVDVRPSTGAFATAAVNAFLPTNFVPRGQITCVEGFGRWLYAGMFTGSHSIVFCGLDASAPLPYVWHPMQLLQSQKVTNLHVDAITSASDGTRIPRRMWAATDASFASVVGGSAPVYYWPIPIDDGQPFSDATFSANYCVNGYVESPYADGGTPTNYKIFRKTELWADSMGAYQLISGVSSGQYIYGTVEIAAAVDATQWAEYNGVPFTTAITPKQVGYHANANNDAVGIAVQTALLNLAPFNNAAGAAHPTSPIIRAVIERYSERPLSNDMITAKLRIADHSHDRQGNEMRDGLTQLTELRTMAKATNPVTLIDLAGATIPAVIIPPIVEEETYQVGSDNPEVVATVKIGVLDASWANLGSFGSLALHPNNR